METHVDVLGEVPTKLELTVPEELLGERQRQLVVFRSLHVSLLEFIV